MARAHGLSPASAARRGRRGRALLHAGERGSLPRCRRGAGHRRARRLRARVSIHPVPGDLASPLLGGPGAGRLGRLLRVRRRDSAAARHRMRLRPRAARIELRPCSNATSTTSSARFISSATTARWTTSATTSGIRSATPDALWQHLLRAGRPSWQVWSLRHRLPSRPGEDLGRRSSRTGAGSALSTTSRSSRRSAEYEHRGRGLHRRTAEAGRRDLPSRSARRDVPRGGRRVRTLLGRPFPGPGGVRL